MHNYRYPTPLVTSENAKHKQLCDQKLNLARETVPLNYIFCGNILHIPFNLCCWVLYPVFLLFYYYPLCCLSLHSCGSRIPIKEFKYFNAKNVSNLSEIWSGLFIPDPDPDFLPIPDPGVKKEPDPGSRICNSGIDQLYDCRWSITCITASPGLSSPMWLRTRRGKLSATFWPRLVSYGYRHPEINWVF